MTVNRALKLARELSAGQHGVTKGRRGSNPNARGNALHAVCEFYLEHAVAYTRVYTPEQGEASE